MEDKCLDKATNNTKKSAEISTHQTTIAQINRQKATLLTDNSQLEEDNKKLMTHISDLEKEVNNQKITIKSISADLKATKKDMDDHKQ